MKTLRLDEPLHAGRMIREGKLVAFPTETVFGLGANAYDEAAVQRLFAAKGRPASNPLIVHLSDASEWRLAARELPHVAQAFLNQFSPGALTVVVPKKNEISHLATAGLDTVGIRVPQCAIARALLKAASVPVAAPSANLSGRPSCTRWQSVVEDLNGRIHAVLCSNPTQIGLESTVVDCTDDTPILLRPGSITLQQLQSVVPETRGLERRALTSGAITARRSPGLHHPHYQPKAKVHLYCEDQTPTPNDGSDSTRPGQLPNTASSTFCGLQKPVSSKSWLYIQTFKSIAEYAENFYEFLRESDRQEADHIFCQMVEPEGIGVALNDRLRRAAGLD